LESLSQLIWVDYIVLGIITISSIISLIRGFVKEVLSLVVWVFAVGISLTFFRQVAIELTPYIDLHSARLGVAFVILMIVSLIIGGLVNYLVSQIVEKTGLSGTDRLLGMVFGAIRGVLLVTMLVWLAGLGPFPEDEWWKQSALLDYFSEISVWLRDLLPADIHEFFNYGKETT